MAALKKNFTRYKNNLHLQGGLDFATTTLITGIFLIGFALELGANEFELGILLSIPLFANLLQLVSAFILEATGSKKQTTLVSMAFGRLLFIIIVLMALGLLEFPKPVLMFAVVLILTNIFTAISSLSLLSWMKDLIPVKKLSKHLGKRNIYATIGGTVAYVIGAYIIDRFPGEKTFGYIFLAAFIFSAISLFALSPIPEKRKRIKAIHPLKFLKRLTLPFKDKNYLPRLKFGMPWALSVSIATPFFLVYLLEDLKLEFFTVSIFLVAAAISKALGLTLWRSVLSKVGSKPIMTITATILSTSPLIFIFINDLNYPFAVIIFIISSLASGGLDLAMTQGMLRHAPRKYDAYYISTYTSLVGFISAIGPILGGLLALMVTNLQHIYVFDFMPALKYIFLISFIGRVICLRFIKDIEEDKARDVEDVLDSFKELRFASIFVNLYGFASMASRIVLVPEKQFFIIQRKAIFQVRKDVKNIMTGLKDLSTSLGRITAKNLPYYKRRIQGQEQQLEKEISQLDLDEQARLKKIPAKVVEKVQQLEENIEQLSKTRATKEVKEVAKEVVKAETRLEQEYKKDLFIKKEDPPPLQGKEKSLNKSTR